MKTLKIIVVAELFVLSVCGFCHLISLFADTPPFPLTMYPILMLASLLGVLFVSIFIPLIDWASR